MSTHANRADAAHRAGHLSEFYPDDYEEKLERIEQSGEILAAWIVMIVIALLFVSLG